MKRTVSETGFQEADGIHASRKRRIAYTEADAQLAQIYEDLADDVPAVRITAAGSLLKYVVSGPAGTTPRLEIAVPRLVKGLCSGRKGARLGFSIALSEILRLAFRLAYKEKVTQFCLCEITDAIFHSTQVDGRSSGQEKRDQLIGRRFAFQAVLQSDIAHVEAVSSSEWEHFLQAFVDLALQKRWLKAECGALLYGYLQGGSGKRLSDERLRSVVDILQHAGLFKTPEGVAIWLLLAKRCPGLLPRSVWLKNDPLSAGERVRLKKVLHGAAGEAEDGSEGAASEKTLGSGSRQSLPSFAWTVILAELYQREDGADFKLFWVELVDSGLFADSSSNERKSLGLQVLSLAISSAPLALLPHTLSKNVVRCLLNQRADPDRYLYEAARVPIVQIEDRARREPRTAPELLRTIYSTIGFNFDQLTKTKAVELIIQQADVDSLNYLVSILQAIIDHPNTKDTKQADQQRRGCADMLVIVARTHRESSQAFRFDSLGEPVDLALWFSYLFSLLINVAYSHEKIESHPVSKELQAYFKTKLVSCLGLLLDHEPKFAVRGLTDVLNALQVQHKDIAANLSQRPIEALTKAYTLRKEVAKPERLEKKYMLQVSELLYTPLILQVYDEDSDGVEALGEMNQSLETVLAGEEMPTDTFVELLLSLVSKPSATFRKLAENVFALLAPDLTPESIQSMVDILQTKEGASGQQELFAQQSDDEGSSGSEEEGLDGIDVDDMSDVELVNGAELEASEDEAETGSTSESSSGDEADEADDEEEEEEENQGSDDELAVFDRKLAEALGTTGLEEGNSDEDGSDMDDEQMMALEPSLANIFKERNKESSKKQDNKGAKENIINFKNRVLDLLMIYAKSQHADVTALDIILPLAMVTRTASTKPTRQKAFDVLQHYFQTCVKRRRLPRPDDVEACFTVLLAILEESKLGGSILHADTCSRSSLFLSRVLIALDVHNLKRVEKMYADLSAEKQADPKSNIRESIFTEWNSWKSNSSEHFSKWASWRQDAQE